MPSRRPAATGVGWDTRADAGWQAAAAASEPSYQQVTAAGLPVRAPMANLVPGAVVSVRGDADAARPDGAEGSVQRSPEGIRSLLSTYYASYRRGRVDDSPTGAAPPSPGGVSPGGSTRPPYPATPSPREDQ